MTLSFPANPTNGQEYTDPNSKVWEFDGVKWNVAVSEGTKQFSGVKVTFTSPIALGVTEEVVAFTQETYDVGNYWTSVTPTSVVIPRTGFYRINLYTETGTNGSGTSYSVSLKRNGVALFSAGLAANQSGVYDETVLLDVGDILELYAAEDTSVGTLTADSYLEIQLIGYTFGGAITPGFEFSGVKVDLSSNISTTSTPTAITWTSTDIEYDVNANAAGSLYWSNTNATRLTIATTGYYRIQAIFQTSADGAADSYTINLRKNGTTSVESGSLGALETLELDETYFFTSTDYLEVLVSNTGNVGTIDASNTSVAITRLGV